MRCLLLLPTLLTIATLEASAHRISQVDFDSIRAATADSKSPYAYAALLKRFQAADTTLTRLEFKYLYYGQVFTKQYHPYGIGLLDDFRSLMKQQKWPLLKVGYKC